MKAKRHNKKAFSTVEYTAAIVFLIAALMVMKKPIARIFMGRWKTAGDSFMHGQQIDYDPSVTTECGRHVPIVDPEAVPLVWGDPVWYNYRCHECCMDRNGPASCPSPGVPPAIASCRVLVDYLERQGCCADACEDGACG